MISSFHIFTICNNFAMNFVSLQTALILVLYISHGIGHHGHHGHCHHGGHCHHNCGHAIGYHDRMSLKHYYSRKRESNAHSNYGVHNVESPQQHRSLSHVKKKGHGATGKSSICSSNYIYVTPSIMLQDMTLSTKQMFLI